MATRHSTSPIATAVVLGLIACSAPARAQSAGPIARAVRAEATRLAAATRPTVAASRQDPGLSAWSRVAGLEPGSDLVVTRSDGSPHSYRLLSVRQNGLTVLERASRAVIDVPRDEVDRIEVVRKAGSAHVWRGLIIGGAIGWAAMRRYPEYSRGDVAFGSGVGAALGAGIGGIVRRLWPPTTELLYQR